MREPSLRAEHPTRVASAWLRAAEWWTPWAILAVGLLVRLPAIACPAEIDVDESGLAAAAMRYAIDVVPWRAADITTSGPLNCLALRAVALCTPRLTYRAIHVAAAVLQCAILLVTWMTLRRVVLPQVTVAAAACSLLLLACAQEPAYVHFSSELVPVLLLSCAAFCGVRAIGGDAGQAGTWWAGSLLLAGLAPWAKLQAAPISLAFWAYAVWHLWRMRHAAASRGDAARVIALATVAFMLPSALFLAVVCAGGAWQDFWQSYVLRNLLYSEDASRFGMLKRVARLFLIARPVRVLLVGGAIMCAAWCACACAGWRSAEAWRRHVMAFFGCYSLAALVAVVKPPWAFPHYDWLLFNPVIIAVALVVDMWWRIESTARTETSMAGRRASSVVCYVALMAGLCADISILGVFQARTVFQRRSSEFFEGVAARVRHLTGDETTLGIWGWAPGLHVATGLIPATRYAIGRYLIDESPQRAFFRTRYLEDLRASMPRVFIDAVAPGFFVWNWSNEDRIAGYPELDRFLGAHYQLAEEMTLTPDDPPVRIYVRR